MGEYDEQIKEIQDEIRKTQYNKVTQHHIGLLKAKIARLKEKAEQRASSGTKGEGYSVKKTGDATVIMVGFPSVGKSTLLNALTNADSNVAAYAFTTLTVVPGMLELNGAQIQLLDVPGIVQGAAAGTGRGKEVLAVVRSADLCMIVVDIKKLEHVEIIKQELYDSGIRLNEPLPAVRIRKKEKGGFSIGTTVKQTHVNKETLKSILKEFGYINADVVVRENITIDRFIDAIKGNRVYVNAIVVVNKADLVGEKKSKEIKKKIKADIMVSAEKKENLEELRKTIWENLGLIRIYMKEPGKDADMEEPLIVAKHSSIESACKSIHQDFAKKFKFARVWGKSAKFDGQKLMKGHVLTEGDILELHFI